MPWLTMVDGIVDDTMVDAMVDNAMVDAMVDAMVEEPRQSEMLSSKSALQHELV